MNIGKLKFGFAVPALVAGMLLLPSCAEWTEPESLGINVSYLDKMDPEKYGKYLEDLRNYKSSDHLVTIAAFNNVEGMPQSQSGNLAALPDSTDYVILENPDNLSEVIISEKRQIKEQKGTQTLFALSYDVIEAEYKEYMDAWELESHLPEETPETFENFLAEKTDYAISLAGKYDYDGIVIRYNGVSPDGLTAQEQQELYGRQELFFGRLKQWSDANPSKLLIFEGVSENIMRGQESVFANVDYIIVDVCAAKNRNEFVFLADKTVADFARDMRLIIKVSTKSLVNPIDKEGIFYDADGTEISAITGGAMWLIDDTGDFVKSGLCVRNAENDYYAQTLDYGNIRKAISIMNPNK